MSWEDIHSATSTKEEATKANKLRRQEAAELAKDYHACFNTQSGQRVIEHLTKSFLFDNDTPLQAVNIEYESAYHNGETGVIKYILTEIQRAENL